jgi:two-component system response regulator QseB
MRLLLIDDDGPFGEGTSTKLRLAGWVSDWACTEETAKRALRSERFDAAILGMSLRDGARLELLNWLRSNGEQLPIIVVCAKTTAHERALALDAGADDCMEKPCDSEELCARLRALTRRNGGQSAPSFRHGALEIDPVARTVTFGNRQITLSPKEYAILECLIKNAGRVTPRERLMASVYGWSDDVGTNALEVHMHNLRAKLPSASLTTVRGVGYRIG